MTITPEALDALIVEVRKAAYETGYYSGLCQRYLSGPVQERHEAAYDEAMLAAWRRRRDAERRLRLMCAELLRGERVAVCGEREQVGMWG